MWKTWPVSPGGSRRSSGTPTSITKQPPGWRCAAALRKHATCALLRGQVPDRVEDEIDEGERTIHSSRREVADRHVDVLSPQLLAEPLDHRVRHVDAMHRHAGPRQGNGDPAGPDRELEGTSVPGELGEEVDCRSKTAGSNISAESSSYVAATDSPSSRRCARAGIYLERAVLVRRPIGDRRGDVPQLGDTIVLEPEDVDDGCVGPAGIQANP
jgi:hypothetical protein